MTLAEFEALPEDSFCYEVPEGWAKVRDFYAGATANLAQNSDD